MATGFARQDTKHFQKELALAVALLWTVCASMPGVSQSLKPIDLTQASLEDLMNVQVTSVSRKEQPLSKTPAAVFVITSEDIRRSGATNLPDVLRMAPGVDVARINANQWAISIRGFNDAFANKVLVLIDGRSVYDPTFSGVFWDVQSPPLEDIERIEVIRGPGGTVWGANAMNGVINIMMKSSKDTQGGLISMATGSDSTADGFVRYGGTLGSQGTYRAYGSYFNFDPSAAATGGEAADAGHAFRGGFRSDWSPSPRDSVTVEGDFQRTSEGQNYTTIFSANLPLEGSIAEHDTAEAGDVLGLWKHTLSNGSAMSLQFYDDYSHRTEEGLTFSHNTVDFDFDDHLTIGSRQDAVWGLGARVTSEDLSPGYSISLIPLKRTDPLFSAFLQDEVRISDSLWLTMGSKFEHNAYTGFELEPSAQLLWTPAKNQAIWVSGARAVRQPSAVDAGIQYDYAILPAAGVPFALLRVAGNPNIKAETLLDFEAGYRSQLGKRFSVDLATFSGYYGNLQTYSPQTPYFVATEGPPHLVVPLLFGNNSHGHTYGAELFMNWSVTNRWRISPGYSELQTTTAVDPLVPGALVEQTGSESPKHQFQTRSSWTLPHNLTWDTSISYVGGLTSGKIPAYTRLDSRVGWRFSESMEVSVTGQNLLTPRHVEFLDIYGVGQTLIERSVYGKVIWRF